MAPEEPGHKSLPLRSLLIRGLPVAVICAAACAVAAGLLSDRRESVYSVDALVLTRDSGGDPATGTSSSGQDEGQGVTTDALLVARRAVLARVARRSNGELTVKELEDAVSVQQVGKTNAVQITVETNRAADAAGIANGVARNFVAMQRDREGSRVREAERVLRRQLNRLTPASRSSTRGAQLREQVQSLSVLEDIGSSAPRVVQEAEAPADPVSPKPKRDAIFGGLFGFLLGGGLGVLWVTSDRRVRNPDEASEVLGAPALATFPRRRRLRLRRKRAREADERAWRVVLLSLRHLRQDQPVRSVSVTTVTAGGDRTQAAWGLARAAATTGERALLIGVEPRSGQVNGHLGDIDGDRLEAVLARKAALSEAVSSVDVDSSRELDVLLGRAPNGHPMVLAESSRLGEAVREAVKSYELVVVDTPSLLERAEGVPVVSRADATVVVLSGREDREQLVALRQRFEALNARVVGTVISSR